MTARALGLAISLPLALAATARADRADRSDRADPAPRLRAELAARSRATIGDRLTVEITLDLPARSAAGEPRFPAWGETWGGAEVIAAGPVEHDAAPDGTRYRQRVEIAAFTVGTIALPAVAVAVPTPSGTETLRTPPLTFDVASVLPAPDPAKPDDPARAPKPPSPPRPLPWGVRFWWTLAAGALLALATGWLALRRAAPSAHAVSEPELPPRAELDRALDRLLSEASTRAEAGRGAEPLAPGLSAALRRYLGREIGFPALESTTSEIDRGLRGRRLPDTLARRAVDLLRRLDLVKFARRPAAPSELEANIAAARTIADEVERHLRPLPASATEGAR